MDLRNEKRAIRDQALLRRNAQPDRDSLSRLICEKLYSLPEFVDARTVMVYLDTSGEVRTQPELPRLLAGERKIAVPYVEHGWLKLFELGDASELAPGTYGILEPSRPLRDSPERQVDVEHVDLVVAPGVAFDRRGARLGMGWGYYDKLLDQLRPDAAIVGLAYECQLVPEIPLEPHDVPMHKIVTERTVYECRDASH